MTSLPRLGRTILAIALGVPIAACRAAAPGIPPAATEAIRKVHDASGRRDVAALEALMARDFTWSFGGDADARQALAEWRANPRYFDELRRVTGVPCGYEDGIVECPRKAGTRFRAGFRKTDAGWRMIYFVGGD